MVNTEKEKAMLITIVNLLKKIFTVSDTQSNMEQFLLSKNIKTASDIEHWQRQFEIHRHKGWL